MQKKAMIAMSGGVDSSVAAYLMVQDGYDCAGATLKLYDNPQCSFPGHRACCTPSDTEDARSVAARLGMLYYVFPMHDEFRHSVIDKFADTYLHGGTPNPCIDCNRFLKFSALLDKARELGCEYIASGHYARREQDPETGRFILKKGLDPTKDQSYVLYAMTQDQLAHTLFPLGGYTKKEIRHIAQGRNVPMFKTNIQTVPVGPFSGPMVCSMRPMTPATVGCDTCRKPSISFCVAVPPLRAR